MQRSSEQADPTDRPPESQRAPVVVVSLDGPSRSSCHHGWAARLAVTKAIRYAIRKVERAHPPVGGILAATVKTGTFCRYEPDPRRPIRWTL